jgi:pilin isopeptide linkage protein
MGVIPSRTGKTARAVALAMAVVVLLGAVLMPRQALAATTFPTTPVAGDKYVSGTTTSTYDGSAWSPALPSANSAGDAYVTTVNGTSVTFVYDGTTSKWYPNKLLNGDFQYPSLATYESSFASAKNSGPFVYMNCSTGYDYKHAAYVTPFDPVSFAWNSHEYQAWNPDKTSGYFAEIQADHSNTDTGIGTYAGGDGNLYSEVSCIDETTSIYQDVATIPGTIYKWSLNHSGAGKGVVAQLQVLIGPTSDPTKLVAQTATRVGSANHVNGVPVYSTTANNGGTMSEVVNGSKDTNQIGFSSTVISTPATTDQFHPDKQDASNGMGSWETYTGTYKVDKGQLITRFQFVQYAATTGSQQSLLDDITFQTAYPLYFDANGGSGTLPMNNATDAEKNDGADVNGNYQNYYSEGDTVSIATAQALSYDATTWDTTKLTRSGYYFAGWSSTKVDPFDTAAEATPYVLSSYQMLNPGADLTTNTLYAVWVKRAVAIEPQVTKSVTVTNGTPTWPATFSYELTPESTTAEGLTTATMPMPGTATGTVTTSTSTPSATAAQTASFGAIIFTKPGTYEYKVKESTESGNGWTCDNTEKTLTVDVTNVSVEGSTSDKYLEADATLLNPAKLEASVTGLSATNNSSYNAVSITGSVTNTYAATSATLDTSAAAILNKTVTSDVSFASKQFDFTLAAAADSAVYTDGTVTGIAPLPTKGTTENNTAGSASFTGAGTQAVDFGTITYTHPGTYTYTVNETTTGAAGDGWTYGSASDVKTVTVKVTDNGKGTLSAAVTTAGAITNGYAVLPVTIYPTVDKNITVPPGDAVNATFGYTIKALNGAPDPEGAPGTTTFNSGDTTKTASLGSITFTKPGTYHYAVDEATPLPAGWSNTSGSTTMTVDVTDVGGALKATVGTSAFTGTAATNAPLASTFENSYATGSVSVAGPWLSVRKTVTGNTTLADESFNFKLTPVSTTNTQLTTDTMPMPGGQAGGSKTITVTAPVGTKDGAVVSTDATAFGTITFKDVGTYVYKTEEIAPDPASSGWSYDTTKHTISIVVTDTDDVLSAEVTIDGKTTANGGANTSAFTNEFDYTPVTLNTATADGAILNKTVTGTNFDSTTFDFTLTPGTATYTDGTGSGTSPLPSSTTGTTAAGSATFSAAGSQAVNFGSITFTQPGTYTYAVSEDNAGADGWVTTGSPSTVTVVVSLDKDTALSIDSVTPAAITNDYEPATLDTATQALLTKNVTANTSGAEKTFDFSIEAGDDSAAYADGTKGTAPLADTAGTATYKAGETGTKTVSFGDIAYTKAGTYTYTVKETTTSGTGWTCDTTAKTVTVTVAADAQTGRLSVTSVAGATVSNSYASTPVTLDTATTAIAQKHVVSSTSSPAAQFKFTIAGINGTPNPVVNSSGAAASTTSTVDVAAQAAASNQILTIGFGNFYYDKAGTYTYRVTEADPGTGWGVTPTEKYADVTVKVTDDGKGALSIDPVTAASITNTYTASGTLDTSATAILTKTVESATSIPASTEFSFTLSAAAESAVYTDGSAAGTAPLPTSTTSTVSYGTAETGAKPVSFGSIAFTKPGTYTYTVTEATPGSGWTADPNTRTATAIVMVTDDKKGGLTASVATPAAITNTYATTATLDTSATAILTKTVESDIPFAQKTFSFTLSAAAGSAVYTDGTTAGTAPLPASTTGTATFSAKGSQPVSFGSIAFKKAGTYTYTVTEATPGSGWTADPNTRTATAIVTVTDDGKGALSAAVTTSAAITNTYSTLPVSVHPSVAKTITVDTGTNPTFPKTFGFTATLASAVDANGTDITTSAPTTAEKTVEFDGATSTPGPVAFDTLTFTRAGTYTYTIDEDATYLGSGWSKTSGYTTMTVVVTDTGGALKATVGMNEFTGTAVTNTFTATTFTNRYSVTSVTVTAPFLAVEKRVTGDKTPAAKTFYYLMTAGDAASKEFMPAGSTSDGSKWVSATAAEGTTGGTSGTVVSDGNTTFGSIEFTKPGTYTYYVKEVASATSTDAPTNADGWTFDTTGANATNSGKGHRVVVEVTNTNGVLGATVTIDDAKASDGGANTNTFTNGFAYTPTTVDPSATGFFTKTVACSLTPAVTPATTFSFRIAGTDGTANPTNAAGKTISTGSLSIVAGETGDKAVTFENGPITYTEPGTYHYLVTEGTLGAGWSASAASAEVTVEVKANADGTLTPTVTPASITNTFNPVSVNPSVKKTVSVTTGTPDWPATFGYTLKAVGTSAAGLTAATMPMPDGATDTEGTATVSTSTPSSQADQTAAFGAITFTKPGLYQYAIAEDSPLPAGWSNTGGAVTMTVQVTDVNGVLTATVLSGEASSVALSGTDNDFLATTFANVYDPASVTVADPWLSVRKVVSGDKTTADATFWFMLKASDAATAAYMPDGSVGDSKWVSVSAPAGTAPGLVVNGAEDSFGHITFDRVGTYSYTVREVAANGSSDAPADVAGWSNDPTVHTVAFVVTDDEGALATRILIDGKEATTGVVGGNVFTNAFSAASATASASGGGTAVSQTPQTGDPLPSGLAALACAAMLLGIGVAGLWRRRADR